MLRDGATQNLSNHSSPVLLTQSHCTTSSGRPRMHPPRPSPPASEQPSRQSSKLPYRASTQRSSFPTNGPVQACRAPPSRRRVLPSDSAKPRPVQLMTLTSPPNPHPSPTPSPSCSPRSHSRSPPQPLCPSTSRPRPAPAPTCPAWPS